MSPYVVIPLLSCIVCAMLAAILYTRDRKQPANRLASALMGCTAFWAFCEVLWNQSSDAAQVLYLVKLAVFGWAPLGAIALHLFVALAGDTRPRTRQAVGLAWGFTALVVAMEFATPWLHAAVERHGGGWDFEFGPAFGPVVLILAGMVVAGFGIGWRMLRESHSEAERSQGRWISLAVIVPLVTASATDAVLPMFGYPVPRLGTASLALLGGVVLWSLQRYGHFVLAPGSFAHEILATLPEGVALLHVDGRVRSANERLAGMLGLRRDELVGLRLEQRLSSPIPTLGEGEGELECELWQADGSSLTVALAARTLRDRMGLEIGTVVVVRDLTELVTLRERVLLSGRLAAVGELAAGIAHEINNPLAFVRANLSLLQQHWAAIERELEKAGVDGGETAEWLGEGVEILEESIEGVDRATAIVRDVRGLAHAGGRERQTKQLDELLEGVLRIARPQLKGRVTVERVIAEDCPVWCAPQELQQVFLNLILNAVHAVEGVEGGGRIRVVTRRENEFVVTSIEDDGCGIDSAIRDRIFDPFFTTKSVGEGTGLGLGIAYGIVRQHGGELFVESEPGEGACFSVHLPLATDTLTGS